MAFSMPGWEREQSDPWSVLQVVVCLIPKLGLNFGRGLRPVPVIPSCEKDG